MVKKEEVQTKKGIQEKEEKQDKKAKQEKPKNILKKEPKKTKEKKLKPKTIIKKEEPEKEKISDSFESDNYLKAVGRRKTSVAVVRLYTKGKKEFIINDKPYDQYFPTLDLQESCSASLKKMKCFDNFRITVKVSGGGVNSQMEAVRHGISRALVLFNIDFKKKLRRAGYLTRDPRQRERKKPGLKRARRAPQWKKR